MKRVQKGHVTLKCWDLGGQPRFRQMWERYCRGVNAIVFIVDIADMDVLSAAKEELHILMSNQTLVGIPLLVLGNKSDLPDRLTVDEEPGPQREGPHPAVPVLEFDGLLRDTHHGADEAVRTLHDEAALRRDVGHDPRAGRAPVAREDVLAVPVGHDAVPRNPLTATR